jgi:uncharacterized membrane protein (UPF0127 family)
VKTTLCAFNVSRQSFINLGVAVADTTLTRLRGLLGKIRMRSDEALWVVPSHGIHTIGLLFPIDVLYLDSDLRVVEAVEHLGPLRIAPLKWRCASVLLLPTRSVYDSGTQVGDQLMICSQEKLHSFWESQNLGPPESPKKQAPEEETRAAETGVRQPRLRRVV